MMGPSEQQDRKLRPPALSTDRIRLFRDNKRLSYFTSCDQQRQNALEAVTAWEYLTQNALEAVTVWEYLTQNARENSQRLGK